MRQRGVQLSPAAGVAAVMAWRRVLQARMVQLRHRADVGAAWRQPSRAPRQSPPAVTLMSLCVSGSAAPHRPLGLPQPVQLRRQRPSAVLQVLQVAVAVERPPVDLARPTAPVAGLRGARTGVVGLRPARAAAGLVEPRPGCDGDLPGPARLPAAHEASPPLAWLPGSDQPTRRARPSRSRIAVPPYSPPVGLPGALLHLARRCRWRVAKSSRFPSRRLAVVLKASILASSMAFRDSGGGRRFEWSPDATVPRRCRADQPVERD